MNATIFQHVNLAFDHWLKEWEIYGIIWNGTFHHQNLNVFWPSGYSHGQRGPFFVPAAFLNPRLSILHVHYKLYIFMLLVHPVKVTVISTKETCPNFLPLFSHWVSFSNFTHVFLNLLCIICSNSGSWHHVVVLSYTCQSYNLSTAIRWREICHEGNMHCLYLCTL